MIANINNNARDLASQGMQVIAIASKREHVEDEKDMTFIGFVAFLDPPKKGVKNTIKNLKKYGVTTKILTGDTDNFVRDSLSTIHSKDFADKIKVLEELSYYKYPFIKQKDLEKTPIPEERQVAEEAKLIKEDIKTAELEFRDIGSDSSEDDSEDTIEEQPLD